MKIAAAGLFAAALPMPLAAQTGPTPARMATPAPTPSAAPARFTLDTSIEAIAADPKGKAVLDKDLVGLLDHSIYGSFKGMSLKQFQSYSPDKMTDAVLARAATDLVAIK